MALLAVDLHERGRLAHDTVVATVMSNLGFVQAMRRADITVHQTAVGDRYVLEAMREGGFTLGGEQSGHVIMSDHATTGDGILSSLHVLQRMARYRPHPARPGLGRDPAAAGPGQRVRRRPDTDRRPGADRGRHPRAGGELGDSGRVLLRPSGTEPLVRVMVEAATPEDARAVADRLADVVRRRLAL